MSAGKPVLLVVEDDAGLQAQLKWAWDDFEVVPATNRAEALAAFARHRPAVVTLDLGLLPDPDGTSEGFALLDAFMAAHPQPKVIVASGHGAHASALTAIERGSYDFYRKPIEMESLGLIVRRAHRLAALEAENRRLLAATDSPRRVLGSVVTDAPAMMEVAHQVERLAGSELAVLLLGESGTGKGLLARALHDASGRAKQTFATVNCAAIPDELFDRELALAPAEGAIGGGAGPGTLFLDEVGELTAAQQAALLRFLDRTDGPAPRIVAATGADMDVAVASERFRADLFYRLAETVVRVPPLSERPGDAVLLARMFLTRYAREMNPAVEGFAADALAAIDAHSWSGNVRELENAVRRAVIMASSRHVTRADLGLEPDNDAAIEELDLKRAREGADRQVIRRALDRTDGNISRSAKLLGVSRPTLYDLLRQYEMES